VTGERIAGTDGDRELSLEELVAAARGINEVLVEFQLRRAVRVRPPVR